LKNSSSYSTGFIRSTGNGQRPRRLRWVVEGDVYYSGGAYYFSTLGKPRKFCFLAPRPTRGTDDPGKWVAHGDEFSQTVRAFTPASADLSESFDQRDGAAASRNNLRVELCRLHLWRGRHAARCFSMTQNHRYGQPGDLDAGARTGAPCDRRGMIYRAVFDVGGRAVAHRAADAAVVAILVRATGQIILNRWHQPFTMRSRAAT